MIWSFHLNYRSHLCQDNVKMAHATLALVDLGYFQLWFILVCQMRKMSSLHFPGETTPVQYLAHTHLLQGTKISAMFFSSLLFSCPNTLIWNEIKNKWCMHTSNFEHCRKALSLLSEHLQTKIVATEKDMPSKKGGGITCMGVCCLWDFTTNGCPQLTAQRWVADNLASFIQY